MRRGAGHIVSPRAQLDVYNWNYGALRALQKAEAAHTRSFPAISLPFLLGFEKKNNFIINSANFSVLDRMDEINFRSPIIGFYIPHLGC